MKARQRILQETSATRRKAELLLRSLLDHKVRSEKQLREIVPGQGGPASIDAAIASTRRMIETLGRAAHELRAELSPEDLELIEQTR